MTEETLETYLRQLIQSHRTSQVTVAWQGGEPTLMGLDFCRKAIEIQEKYRLLGNVREKHQRELVGSAQQYKFGQTKCAGHKGFFRRVTEPLKIMAMLLSCGRPASDVMPIPAENKEVVSKAYQTARPEQLCPCSSGLTYQRCRGWKRPERDRRGRSKVVGQPRSPARMTIKNES
jgi:hypothetical protein